MWMTSCTGSVRGGFGKFWKKSIELSLAVRRRRVTFACSPRPCGRCHTRWKSQNRKNVYLSPYVEEPFNSKVIKSFVPELRNRKCFSYFGIPMFYVYMLWTSHEHFTHIRIMGMVQTNHTFDFKHSNIISFIHNKNKHRIIEAATISHYNTIKPWLGFIKISPYQS